jgi:alkanesulfonate monooxygenase SsuD/methylene tetrahydromethanopterin reductase-like flavin-dependent oxidoreductase (luciferase family)
MVDKVAAAGTSDEVTEKIEQFVAAGVRHFIFLPATTRASDFDATVRTLIEDVMPRVRSRAAW